MKPAKRPETGATTSKYAKTEASTLPDGVKAPKAYKDFRNAKTGGAVIRIALKSGHVALVGPEWKPLHPRFHTKARTLGLVAKGEGASEPFVERNGPNSEGAAQGRRDRQIREAIELVQQRDVPGDWTRDGVPNTNVIANLVKFTVTKAEVLLVWAQIKDELGLDDDAGARKAAQAVETGNDEDGEEEQPDPSDVDDAE